MEISQFINFKDKLHSVLVSVGLLTVISIILQWLGYFIYNYQSVPIFIKQFPEPVVVILFLIYLISLFFMFKAVFQKVWIVLMHLNGKVYKFRSDDWPDKWIFSGKPELEISSELFIKSSRAGCLLKNHYWKDFKMTFEMKFVLGVDKKIGIVFRADDLDNYFMLELSNKDNEIRPHVRYHGGWDVIHPNKSTEVFKEEDGKEGYRKITLEVKHYTVYLYVNGTLELTWILPTHVDVMYREAESKEKSDLNEKYVQEIPFRNRLGRVGFRAHPGQGAIIRGLTIKPL